MSVKRRDLVKYLEENEFHILREGKRHTIFTNNEKTIPIKSEHNYLSSHSREEAVS